MSSGVRRLLDTEMQFVFLILLSWVGLAAAGGNPDLDALLKFKEGIKEDRSGHLINSWNTDNSPESDGCPFQWYGVQCTGGRVTSITLNGMDLAGEVSFSALVGMEMLRNFSISNNHLTGILPREVGSIRSLEHLDLSLNSFVGSIPDELTEMEKLVSLNLSSNNFSGTLPSGFGKLRQLSRLDLRANNFTGDLEGFLAELQNVTHVDFSQNGFSGSLKSGSGDPTLATSFQYINISNNRLSGQLFPQVMPSFDDLEVFDASDNQFAGQIPSFNFLFSLRILRLGNNQFSGPLPEALLQESSMVLNDLDLSSNQLQGSIRSISSATLKNLNLSSNRLTGPLPLKVGSCAIVDLSNNMLSGNLSAIRNWGNYVEVIQLSSNSLTGSLPNETYLLRLTSLKVSNNLLLGELPLVIGTYPELSVIDLSLNQLYGPLPPSLFTSFRLTELNLSGNSFVGPIPLQNSPKAVSMSSDAPLYSSQNLSLVSLDLSNNSLSGFLPLQIGTLNGLKLLNMAKNNISGQIPQEIGMLRSLVYLDLSNNHLEGSIPDNLSDELVGFNVSYNDLSGTVPDNLLRFPDSAFHPGNALLIFPRKPSSNASNFTDKGENGRHAKHLIRNILIAGFVGTVAVIILVSVLIYYRASTANIRGKDINQHNSPVSNIFGLRRNVETPPVSLNLPQDHLLYLGSTSAPPEHGDISISASEHAETGTLESMTKGGLLAHSSGSSPHKNGKKPSLSLFSSSPHSSSPSILKVCSPDRLAGDLHLFDNSFVFTAEELSRAPAEIIGRSCHGTSYKATLDNGHVVTVKWLKEGFAKGKKEFAREARKLGNIRHPNIVSLRGYYWGPKEHERLIISYYIDATSLTAHLCEFEPRKLPPLSLNGRLSIAVDVAHCLNYLHNERAIPHGNLKSTNIILQVPDLNALLSDYSLHRLMTPAGMAEQVLNAGALGYRPPEFASTSKPCPSLKSDVYAFGVIMLELLTGKSAGEIASGNPGVVDLTDWVRLLASENRSFECFDRFIPEVDSAEGPPKVLEDMLQVALRCIRSASERPEISTIFEELSSMAI